MLIIFAFLSLSEMTIIFDSGIRTGSDVFKAIALGAHAVSVGRLYVWGMAHEGMSGCRHVMKSLLAVSLPTLGRSVVVYSNSPSLTGSRYYDDCGGIWIP